LIHPLTSDGIRAGGFSVGYDIARRLCIDISAIGGFDNIDKWWYYPTVALGIGHTNDPGDCKAKLAYEGSAAAVDIYYLGVNNGD